MPGRRWDLVKFGRVAGQFVGGEVPLAPFGGIQQLCQIIWISWRNVYAAK